jgi:hypothetical protein
MTCPECPAFRSNHKVATERYAALTKTLHRMASAGLFEDPAYQKLKVEVRAGRVDCQQAREALRVHREGHKITGLSPP